MRNLLLRLVAATIITVPTCFGSVITIPALLRGSVGSAGTWASGGSGTSTGNYLAGSSGGLEGRSVFVFDLTGLAVPVSSASLQLQMNSNTFAFASPDPSETYTIFDYLLDPSVLGAGDPGVAVFTDLGSGTSFGSAVLSEADTGTLVIINLNASGISAINAHLGSLFALGGRETTFSGTPGNEFVFGSSLGLTAQLAATTPDAAIPEPYSIGLTGLGLAFLLWRRRAA